MDTYSLNPYEKEIAYEKSTAIPMDAFNIVLGVKLNEQEKKDLVAFMRQL